MKNIFMFALLALIVLAITNTSLLAGEDKKDKSCAGGCCQTALGTQSNDEQEIAMAEMHDHNQHKHDGHKKDTADMQMHNQHHKDTTVNKENQKSSVEYTCSMHPEIKSDKPGKCPKCGMTLVEKKKEETSLMKKKMHLMMEGKYNCCIEEACNVCVEHGGCDCKNAVKNDKPVCDECYKGWQNGEGDVSGKTLKDIKHGEHHHHKDKK